MAYLKDGQDFNFPADFGFTGSLSGNKAPRSPVNRDDNEYGDGSYMSKKRGGRVKMADGGVVDDSQGGAMPDTGPDPSAGMKRGGPVKRALGGMIDGAPGPAAGNVQQSSPLGQAQNPLAGVMQHATVSMPLTDAQTAIKGAATLGRVAGAGQALRGLQTLAARRGMAAPPAGPGGNMPSAAAAPSPVPGMAKGGFLSEGAIRHPGRMKEGAKREGVSTHQYMEEHKQSPGSLGDAARLGLRMTGGDLSPHKRKG